MCDSQRPLNGADSEPIHVTDSGEVADCDCPHTYRVEVRDLYDTAIRETVIVSAHSEREARALARDMKPGYFPATVRAA